jgi:hypothetical protein
LFISDASQRIISRREGGPIAALVASASVRRKAVLTCSSIAPSPLPCGIASSLKAWSKAMFIIPGPTLLDTEDWWLRTRKQVPKKHRRDFDTVTILLHWKIWKERNSRIFDDQAHTVDEVFDSIRDDIAMWRSAGLVLSS